MAIAYASAVGWSKMLPREAEVLRLVSSVFMIKDRSCPLDDNKMASSKVPRRCFRCPLSR